MKCFLCSLHFLQENFLKKYYVNQHFINKEDVHFNDLFTPDTIDKTCRICRSNFNNARSKKKHKFLLHYGTKQQIGGRGPGTSDLRLNILRRSPTTYYSISFEQHKNFYDFFSTRVEDTFLNSVYQVYRPNRDNKIQGYA